MFQLLDSPSTGFGACQNLGSIRTWVTGTARPRTAPTPDGTIAAPPTTNAATATATNIRGKCRGGDLSNKLSEICCQKCEQPRFSPNLHDIREFLPISLSLVERWTEIASAKVCYTKGLNIDPPRIQGATWAIPGTTSGGLAARITWRTGE